VRSEFARVVIGKVVAAAGDSVDAVANCKPLVAAVIGEDAAAKAAAADKAGACSAAAGLDAAATCEALGL